MSGTLTSVVRRDYCSVKDPQKIIRTSTTIHLACIPNCAEVAEKTQGLRALEPTGQAQENVFLGNHQISMQHQPSVLSVIDSKLALTRLHRFSFFNFFMRFSCYRSYFAGAQTIFLVTLEVSSSLECNFSRSITP